MDLAHRFGTCACCTRAARPRQYSRPLQMGPDAHLHRLGRLAARLRRARDEDRRVRRAPGHARQGRRSAAGGDEAVRRHRPAHLQGLVLRLAEARRGSARQPDQRAPPAGADPVREGEPGERVVQPGTARDSAADDPAVDEGNAGARGLPLRARGSLPPAGARARRERASTCSRCRAGFRRRRTTPTPRCRPPTSSTRRCSCRPAPRSR